MPLERNYQPIVIRRLKREFPGCFIMKNDESYCQGIPDLTVLFRDKWALLETKADEDSPLQPNQKYYIDMFHQMSYASFVHPGNIEVVIHELQRAFEFVR